MIKLDLEKIIPAPDDWSEVFDYREDIDELEKRLNKIKKPWRKLILVGNGGSITSYDAYLAALKPEFPSQTVWTMESDFLRRIKEEFSKEETVVVAVSKSGQTLGLIEALLYFTDYDVICVTDPRKGTLKEIADRMSWPIIPHPPVGGRFSGGTSSAFAPAILAGLDIREIQEGIARGYKMKDEAYSLSRYYFELEKKGYGEIYLPIYSERLKGFQNLIIQLIHESVCKDGEGQTVYSFLAPEAQHHTNQRFFGGRRNVIGTFITVEEPSHALKIEVPEKLRDVDYKESELGLIDGLPYQQALKAEYLGIKGDADKNNIPNVTIALGRVDEQSAGALVAFWHLVAFYSSLLRGVNPFDQPAVEASKNITLEIIKRHKSKSKS